MSRAVGATPHSEQDYEIRPAKSYEETRAIWWPFMQNEEWVCYITFYVYL